MQAFIQQASDSQIYKYLEVAPPALLAYETLIMFPSEFELLWKRKLRLPGFFYLVARYVTLASMILQFTRYNISTILPLPDTNVLVRACDVTYRTVSSLALVGATAGHALAITRIYAVSAGNRFIMVVLFVILIGNMTFTISIIPNTSCSNNGGATVKLLLSVLVASIFTAAFHIAIFCGTLVHAVRLRRLQRHIMPIGGRSLAQLFIQQGVVWFFIVFSWNISTIIWNEVDMCFAIDCTLPADTLLPLRSYTTSGTVEPVSAIAFRVTVSKIRSCILQDVGDPEYDEKYFADDVHSTTWEDQNEDPVRRASEKTTTIMGNHHRRTITIAEFPWALGSLDLEAGKIIL
ncbi:hypothetical protein BU17DRAFT_63486 [Hysterangium stoloniferum]|nr:hypothetical protein BU17DRAFT_63486 [Hysterangium stoloniferum]